MQTAVCQPNLDVGGSHILVPISGLRFTPVPGIMSKTGPKLVRTQPRPILPKQRIIVRTDSDSSTSSSTGRDDWVRSHRELLRRKFEQRPSRERLVTQHILLSDGRVSPLIEQQARLLRQNRIKNNLSRKLGQRPGPLELVTRKILQVDAELEHAIKEGRLSFTPTRDPVDEDEEHPPITPDMEVVSHVAVRQPPKSLGSLTSKGILRKPGKGNPYKTFEQPISRSKTKTPESRIEVLEEPPRQPQIPRNGDQNNYELLLQQQQLFLQWQNEPGLGSQEGTQSSETTVIDQGLSRASPSNQIVRVRKLSDLKVQDLKNECKKRQLPVSGAKPQLLDRLRVFEKEILGATPPPSPPIQKDEVQVISSISGQEQHKESLMLSHNNEYSNVSRQGSPPEIIFQSETPIRAQHQQKEYVQQATMRPMTQLVPVQGNPSQLVQLVDDRGNILGTVQLQPPSNDNTPQTVVMQSRILTSAHQPMETVAPARVIQTQTMQKQNDNSFCFAQMGSGGHFTAVQQNDVIVEQPKMRTVPAGTMMVNTVLSPRPQMTAQMVTNKKISMSNGHPGQHQQSQPQQQTVMSSQHRVVAYQPQNHYQEVPRVVKSTHQTQQHVVNRASPKLQSSPRVADHPECSPNMPHCDGTSRVENCSPLEIVKDDEKITLDPNDPASVLTPSTLQMHEDMLRKQHKLIESLEKEVATAQDMLRKQQQIILAAKKNQQKIREKQRFETEEGAWIRDTDIRNMNKTHIQHFLQHKSHVQKVSNIKKEHNRLKITEERLQEELHVDQAVHDIVRLIKQDPRTALLIVQLLRKYQLERTSVEPQTSNENTEEEMEMASSESPEDQPEIIENDMRRSSFDEGESNTIQSVGSHNEQHNASNNAHGMISISNPSPPSQQQDSYFTTQLEDDKHENVDMEAIFKSVLEDASRALSSDTPVQNVECTVSASMDSPKQNTNQQHQWNPMVRQTVYVAQPSLATHESPKALPEISVDHQSQQNMQQPTQSHPLRESSQQNNNNMVHQEIQGFPQTYREVDGGYPSLDDVMAVVRADADFSDGSEPFGGIEYGSAELAELLGDDWLNCADRSISTDGQYIPFHNDESGRSTDPMSLGIPMDTSSSHQMNGGMDWLDEVLHHEPVDAQLFGH